MLDEGFEEDTPEGSEKKPLRTYVSNAQLNDAEKLARENERLKKILEKEQFFNRLLDQELKELKNNPNAEEPQYPNFSEKKGLSRGAVFFIFLIIAGGGGFFVYKWYTKTPAVPFIVDGSSSSARTQAISDTTAEAQTKLNQLPAGTPSYKNYDPLADSNDIVSKKKQDPVDDKVTLDDQAANNVKKDLPKKDEKKAPETIVPDDTEEETLVDETPVTKPNKPVTQPASTAAKTNTPANNTAANKPPVNNPATTASSQSNNPTTSTPVNNNPVTTPPPATRRVIGFYTNISKANFYSAPDESTMTTSFLYQGTPVRLGALDDKNGFIYVIYVNSVGYKKEGWLSKKDLKKIE